MSEDDKDKTFKVGLTGGIASGKSTVAALFADLGVPVIDTDVIAREVVQPGQSALQEISERFGESVISSNGHLDRVAMRKLIFADDKARLDLEAILHPRIGAEVVRQSDMAAGAYQIIVVPLLIDSPLRHFVDRILVVDCDEKTQISRLLLRDAETATQARRILEAQPTRKERLAIADDVIQNDKHKKSLRVAVNHLHRKFKALSLR